MRYQYVPGQQVQAKAMSLSCHFSNRVSPFVTFVTLCKENQEFPSGLVFLLPSSLPLPSAGKPCPRCHSASEGLAPLPSLTCVKKILVPLRELLELLSAMFRLPSAKSAPSADNPPRPMRPQVCPCI